MTFIILRLIVKQIFNGGIKKYVIVLPFTLSPSQGNPVRTENNNVRSIELLWCLNIRITPVYVKSALSRNPARGRVPSLQQEDRRRPRIAPVTVPDLYLFHLHMVTPASTDPAHTRPFSSSKRTVILSDERPEHAPRCLQETPLLMNIPSPEVPSQSSP